MGWVYDTRRGPRDEGPGVSEQAWASFKRMSAKAGHFPPEAFQFVREGLGHTSKMVHDEGEGGSSSPTPEESRHVSGQQLCLGLRDYAIKRYGLLARAVLGRWNVKRTDDFGRIVFAMIDEGLMRKTDQDSLDDFSNVFDFEEAFGNVQMS